MKDPAFLYYDGDAARDVSHMNRLERGCYFDLIQAQRKFRGFTVEQARKILGKDFEDCWNAIELILECDNGIYFIPWVKESICKRADFNKKQAERIQNYWDKKNNPDEYRGISTDIPLENENGIVIENEIIIKPEIKKPKVEKIGTDSAFIICRDAYFEYYRHQTNKTPTFNGAQGANLKRLLPCIRQTMVEEGIDNTDENVLQSFKVLLTNLPKWIKKGLSINLIYSQYDGIIAEIRSKSGASQQSTMQNIIDQRNRQREEAAANG